MRYVVKHFTRGVGKPGPHETEQYLAVINHNPYNRHDREGLATLYADDISEAFHFKSEAAAELAAVFVGGEVVPLPE